MHRPAICTHCPITPSSITPLINVNIEGGLIHCHSAHLIIELRGGHGDFKLKYVLGKGFYQNTLLYVGIGADLIHTIFITIEITLCQQTTPTHVETLE